MWLILAVIALVIAAFTGLNGAVIGLFVLAALSLLVEVFTS
jgi:hypothetical protein